MFFGNLSPWEIIISLIALSTGAYTLYRNLIERVRISAYPGDTIGLVILPDGSTPRFHVGCNFVNKSVKMGTVHHLEAKVRDAKGTCYHFHWRLFYEYVLGGRAVQKGTDPYPIAVAPMSGELLFIEFEVDRLTQDIDWSEGEYKFEIVGWVNRKSHQRSPNLKSVFHVNITREISKALRQAGGQDGSVVIRVPVSEWSRSLRGQSNNEL